MKALFGLLGDILLGLAIGAWRAWVVARLWLWFVVPSFTWAPPLRAWQVFGILVFINTAKNINPEDLKERTTTQWVTYYVMAVLYPAMMLFSGWLALTVLR